MYYKNPSSDVILITILPVSYPSMPVMLGQHPSSLCWQYPKSLKMMYLQKIRKMSLTSSLSERAIFCCVTTV
jgi:hypothetical protein